MSKKDLNKSEKGFNEADLESISGGENIFKRAGKKIKNFFSRKGEVDKDKIYKDINPGEGLGLSENDKD